jgi:hypothetical protein
MQNMKMDLFLVRLTLDIQILRLMGKIMIQRTISANNVVNRRIGTYGGAKISNFVFGVVIER